MDLGGGATVQSIAIHKCVRLQNKTKTQIPHIPYHSPHHRVEASLSPLDSGLASQPDLPTGRLVNMTQTLLEKRSCTRDCPLLLPGEPSTIT